MKKITVLNKTENIQTQKDSIHTHTQINNNNKKSVSLHPELVSPQKRGKN